MTILKYNYTSFENDTGALSLALLTGDKSLLTDETYSYFTDCGTSHIMAVSGLHTSVICMGFYVLLKTWASSEI